MVSHLICGGVYDASTGLIYKGGRYFDPTLGIWLALLPLVVVQLWRERKGKRRGFPWLMLILLGVCLSGWLIACNPTEEQMREMLQNACIELPEPGPFTECTAMPTTGAELAYEPDEWNDCWTTQMCNNCYAYALNRKHSCEWQSFDTPNLLNPGDVSGTPFYGDDTSPADVTREKLTVGAVSDGLLPINCDQPCGAGQYKVALAIDPYKGGLDDADYHWYRQDKGGCWSSKPGQGYATNIGPAGEVISDPRIANRDYTGLGGLDYSEFIGCFCVP
jgi:hypothetical protein